MKQELEVRRFGPVSGAARVFRRRGARFLAVTAKVTFVLGPSGLQVATPEPIVWDERHLRGHPIASLTHASDAALPTGRAEIVVVGCAYAAAAGEIDVRLELVRGEEKLIDKRLLVRANERGPVPVVYESARGGMTSQRNPVGMQQGPLVRYAEGGPEGGERPWPTGLGPIPSAWPVRRRLRGSLAASDAFTDDEVTLPADYDVAHGHGAPDDQRVDRLLAGDRIGLWALHPRRPRVDIVLPVISARAVWERRANDRDHERREIPLRLESVHIEPDRDHVELVFRGVSPVPDGAAVRVGIGAVVDGAFEFPPLDQGALEGGGKAALPRASGGTEILEPSPPARRSSPSLEPQRDAEPSARAATLVLESQLPSPGVPSTPFGRRAAPRDPSGPRGEAPPGSPWASRAEPVVEPAGDLAETLVRAVPAPPSPKPSAPGAPTMAARAPTPPDPQPAAATASPPTPAPPAAPPAAWTAPVEPAPPPPPKPAPLPRANVQSVLYRKKK